MSASASASTGFWSRSSVWKAALFVVAYVAFYLLVGLAVGTIFSSAIDADALLGDATTILLGLALPIAIGGAGVTLFLARQGWLREIFGRQPVGAPRWMWIAPIIVVVVIAGHLVGTDWDAWGVEQVIALAVAGACIGFTEEIVTRGAVVKMVRDAGHREQVVAVVSSLLFALMHLSNLVSGMDLATVLPTAVFALGFGTCMYLTMRVTGTIWAAIVLHGLTDPTTMLTTGGIDETTLGQTSGAAAVAGIATLLLIVIGIGSLLFVRGRARTAEAATA